jgi:chromosome segregation ATPase
LDLAENEMTNKITELQTEKEKLKRSMEILQDGNHECGLQLADYKRQMNDMENMTAHSGPF